ncbi:hypothetical protein RCL1_007526 [Eukaryota sp. TZLM3-RCL]
MSTFTHNILQILLSAQSTPIHTDFYVMVNEEQIPCHKAILSHSSKLLNSLIEKNQDSYDLPEGTEASLDDVVAIIRSFYGQELPVSEHNALPVFEVSKILASSELSTLAKTVITKVSPSTFSIPLPSILSNLSFDQFKDHSVVYKDTTIKIHKFLLTSAVPYFQTKFSLNEIDQYTNDPISDFSQLLKVEENCFASFFKSLYDGEITVTTENIFDYNHLAFYFKLSEFEKFTKNFINTATPTVDWICPALVKADYSEDHQFVSLVREKLASISELHSAAPIAVDHEVIKILNQDVDVAWLFKSTVHSFLHYSNNQSWTPVVFESLIEQLDLSKLDVDTIFDIITPLLDVDELFSWLAKFSIQNFSKFHVSVPLSWFSWFISQCDSRKEFEILDQISNTIELILPETRISNFENLTLNFETLHLFSQHSKSEHLILWTIKSLIKSWKKSKLAIDQFSKILMIFDLQSTAFDSVYLALNEIFDDLKLRTLIFEFISLKVVPRLITEINTNQNLIKDVGENTITQIKSDVAQLREEVVRVEGESKKEVEALKEEHTKTSTTLSQIDVLLPLLPMFNSDMAWYNKRMKEFQQNGGVVRFVTQQKGSYLTIDNGDKRVSRNSSNNGSFSNSFVPINHPVSGTVVLKFDSYNSSYGFQTYIGFMDANYLQSLNTNYLIGFQFNSTYFYIDGKNERGLSNPSQGQCVHITFNGRSVTFSLPFCNYHRTIEYQEGRVFGIALQYYQNYWSLSSQ